MQRPQLHVEGEEYQVLELSEGGASVALEVGATPAWKRATEAILILADGTELTTHIISKRNDDLNTLALQFVKALPMSVIMAEQRRLLAIYPRRLNGNA